MNKKDLVPVIVLALMIPLWMYVDRTFIAPKYPAKTPAPITEQTSAEPLAAGNIGAATLTEQSAAPVAAVEAVVPPAEEVLATLENSKVRLELTSLGGGIKSATLKEFPELNEEGSHPVLLDFSGAAALAYEGLSGIGNGDSLAMQAAEDGKSATFTKTWNTGLSFQRTIAFGDDYLVSVKDRFTNQGANPWNIPALRILTGHMQNPADMKAMKGLSILGVDSYSPLGINYWGREFNSLFKQAGKPAAIDAVPETMRGAPVDWVAAKNKFFTQILAPKEALATMAILVDRDMEQKAVVPHEVAAALAFAPVVVEAGGMHELEYTYYIGPKNYSILQAAGNHMECVMEFETTGFWSFMNWLMQPSRRALLWTMNMFHAVIPNYGIAIILLTLLVRVLFWPLTHKSTESMRRMQELQPEIKALQAKYKKDPPRLQQETMKLYKEKKVNPMGGCLPMFVQIPVFIALFTVLRNAIELRYAGFLWIADLSSPENLFMGKVPFVGSLNILPLLMSASMVWQQKMTTPSMAATPEQQQQQKMMMVMMPIMMLFFFYSMPSGLVLYWTTSNLMMIGQTGIRNMRKKLAQA